MGDEKLISINLVTDEKTTTVSYLVGTTAEDLSHKVKLNNISFLYSMK